MVVGTTLGVIAALGKTGPPIIRDVACHGSGFAFRPSSPRRSPADLSGLWINLFDLDSRCPWAAWNNGAARNMVLPVIVLSLAPTAVIARLTKAAMIEGAALLQFHSHRPGKGLPTFAVNAARFAMAGLLPQGRRTNANPDHGKRHHRKIAGRLPQRRE